MRIQYSDWLKSMHERFGNTIEPTAIDNMSGFAYGMMQEILIEMLQEISKHDCATRKQTDDIINRIDGISERLEELEDYWLEHDDDSKAKIETKEEHGYGCPCDTCQHMPTHQAQ